MQVTEALLHGTLDRKTAGLVLYALQTASSNLRHMQKEAEADADTAVCNRYDSLEQDYELGDCDELRIEDPVDKKEAEEAEKARAALQNGEVDARANQSKYDDVTALIARGEKMGFLHTKGVCWPRAANEDGTTDEPVRITDRLEEDKRVRIPLQLSETQYLQAKSSIEEYEEKHNIDAEHPKGRKPVPQRPAISQKIFLGARKPVVSVALEEQPQLAVGDESQNPYPTKRGMGHPDPATNN